MEMFTLNDEVAHLDAILPELRGAARLSVLVTLSWQLRQRNPRRAIALIKEAQDILTHCALSETECQLIVARLALVDAEIKWLQADLTAADADASRAMDLFMTQGDEEGVADAHWIAAWIASDRGHCAARDANLDACASHARAAGDLVRADIAEAALARLSIWRYARADQVHWTSCINQESGEPHPALASWINDYQGALAFQSNDFGHAAALRTHAYEMALETGQIQRAICAAINIGAGFAHLNDHFAALEWKQRGLDLALPTGWPYSIGLGLIQTSETLRLLGRLDTAHDMLAKARHILTPLVDSRCYTLSLRNLGDLALDQGSYFEALETFRQLEERADALRQTDFQTAARRGQAHALSYLNRPQDALHMGTIALAMAHNDGSASQQIATLRVLAEIHSRHELPFRPANQTKITNPALYYLLQAKEVGEQIEGYIVPDDLLDAIADGYNATHNTAAAFAYTRLANHARKKTHSQEAINHAIALQVRNQTEHERAEGERHRQMAVSEAKRAEGLQQTSLILKRLDTIGQEITAHLDLYAVFQLLDRHLNGLLDATHFAVYLLDPDGFSLQLTFGVEEGKALPAHSIELTHSTTSEVQCVRERHEILINLEADPTQTQAPPGTNKLPMRSKLFAPLAIGEQILGVMTIQSLRQHAYGERERLIFRTLCAYGAIAFDNASAYRHLEATLHTLRDTQAELVAAMQAKHEAERAKVEAEHHRQLAASEAERAEILQQTSATLEHLSTIGQEITAQLDAGVVYQSLNRHVSSLLNAGAIAIYLLDPDHLTLNLAFDTTGIQSIAPIPLSDQAADSTRCARDRHEVISHQTFEGQTLCVLYAPLMLGERILGVMAVHANNRNAYNERECLIFRSLCAYGAIALDNAQAYQYLKHAQEQLINHEKLAALGALVAGVAHELNTPIGNSLMMASAWQEKVEDMEQKLSQKKLQLNELSIFLEESNEAAILIMRALSNAADLVASFKQVAVDRTTAHRRLFELQQTSHEIIATMMTNIRQSGHAIRMEIPDGIYMDGYPGPYGQIISNFINNALLHGFAGRPHGHMVLSASLLSADRVQICFQDDGAGISEHNLTQIFEPFFTTKRGQGGSGLGLSIIYNIVTSLLHGHISVESTVGKGTTFTLDLPLNAPIHPEDTS
jgi:signal transduction histidine kinase